MNNRLRATIRSEAPFFPYCRVCEERTGASGIDQHVMAKDAGTASLYRIPALAGGPSRVAVPNTTETAPVTLRRRHLHRVQGS